MRKSLAEFVDFWKVAAITEKQGYQLHFIELCDILGVPRPSDHDPDGSRYTFEKHVNKTDGTKGFADVWFRDHFAWEYKGPHKDLKGAYKQLNDYREDLLNPPLLVVSDFDRFEVHTNFANTRKRVYAFNLSELERNQITAACPLPPLQVLRALFGDYNELRPNRTDAYVTEEAAKQFSKLAERLEIEHKLTVSREQIAHFLMRLLFCLFADSIGLLPNRVFRRLIDSDNRFYPRKFLRMLTNLFAAMAEPDGIFGEHIIKHFNGGLFDSSTVIELDKADLGILHELATRYNWAHVAPAIFGTLFERSLDPARRSLIGAHYTSEEDILLLIEPVVMRPLQHRWEHVRSSILVTLGLPTTAATEAVIPSEAQERAAPVPPDPKSPGAPSMTASSSWVGSTKSRPTQNAVIQSAARSAQSKDLPDAYPAEAARTILPIKSKRTTSRSLLNSNPEAESLLAAWFDELAAVRILDPACGSGNFLYVALRRLLDLWKDARDFAIQHNIQIAITYAVQKMPSPSQLYGIETEFYAHELASIVVWIGYLQWKHEHGITEDREPILQKLSNIEHADAIMRYNADGHPYEPTWPATDFIIGNPPFLGGKLLRRELGDKYVDDLFDVFRGRVKAESDLVVYWFEKARAEVEVKEITEVNSTRAGLLATQAIRGGANRNVLERIQKTGHIFWAWSDRKWTLEGASVRVSMIGFQGGNIPGHISSFLRDEEEEIIRRSSAAVDPMVQEHMRYLEEMRQFRSKRPHGGILQSIHAEADPTMTDMVRRMQQDFGVGIDPATREMLRTRNEEDAFNKQFKIPDFLLDGQLVPFIHPDLTTGSNTASAVPLKENRGICFMGTTKVGPFDIDSDTAHKMLSAPLNPNGRPNSDVVRPWVNALDITRRPRNMFIVDFGTDMTEAEAALYEMPFEYVKHHVRLVRIANNRETYAAKWWIHGEPRAELRKVIKPLSRYILTSRVSKHRLFIWLPVTTLPDSATFAIAREDDYFFGVLHSTLHELWALHMGTQLESRPRYTPDSTFDTFPFPWPPGTEPSEAEDPRVKAIADAARELVRLRDAWLNPAPAPGEPPISEADLKDRTLTKLYNLRAAGKCAWLENAHRALDEAVFAAYGWPSNLTTQQILANLLALNHQRAATTQS